MHTAYPLKTYFQRRMLLFFATDIGMCVKAGKAEINLNRKRKGLFIYDVLVLCYVCKFDLTNIGPYSIFTFAMES